MKRNIIFRRYCHFVILYICLYSYLQSLEWVFLIFLGIVFIWGQTFDNDEFCML